MGWSRRGARLAREVRFAMVLRSSLVNKDSKQIRGPFGAGVLLLRESDGIDSCGLSAGAASAHRLSYVMVGHGCAAVAVDRAVM